MNRANLEDRERQHDCERQNRVEDKLRILQRLIMRGETLVFVLGVMFASSAMSQEVVGIQVTPHQFSDQMRWRRPPKAELSAKIELYVKNTTSSDVVLSSDQPPTFDGKSTSKMLSDSEWAWHDTPSSWLDGHVTLPPESLTVFTINGKSAAWGIGTKHQLQMGSTVAESVAATEFAIEQPVSWLSAVTFLSVDEQANESDSVRPNKIVVHLANNGEKPLQILSVKLWLPKPGSSHHIFHPAREFDELDCFPSHGVISAKSKGGFTLMCERLPLTYTVVELRVKPQGGKTESLWAHLRIRREVFDISGGWVASKINGRNSLAIDDYLAILKRMHINTGQIQEVAGYTDNPDQYKKLPLKRFNRLWPLDRYDTDSMLPSIHAVEFLGEPQYGGGRPVAPQEVWKKLAPYQASRLPTSLTLSEEHSWRYYAGLSDYPHYDAYRVTAPAADSWRAYDRWGGDRIRWGAPLETIGVMTRSLRELSRPRPIAYWSQGAHDGWKSRWNPRRSSPTPDELRAQAWHGLANRITSLYWFNLSLKSLVAFPDLIEPITRVNREIRMLDELFLNGDAYEYRRTDDGWDLSPIASATAVLMVANDLRYRADIPKREFVFPSRDANFEFKRPDWLAEPLVVFRVDADGTHDVTHTTSDGSIELEDRVHVAGIYLATTDISLRSRIDTSHATLIELEKSTLFDPAKNANDLARLKQYALE